VASISTHFFSMSAALAEKVFIVKSWEKTPDTMDARTGALCSQCSAQGQRHLWRILFIKTATYKIGIKIP
jgi:hypothetical protein